jgi:hypothetical protein
MTEQHGDKTRCCRRRRGAASPPGAPPSSGDILWEIFLRLPPLPSSLLRVSLVCKRWRRLAADPEFLHRFRARHRKAPLLGLFSEAGGWLAFTPVVDPPDRIPPQRLSMQIDTNAGTYPFQCKLLGCRHGRVLVLHPRCREVLVCDPITGDQLRIALPPEFDKGYIRTYMTEGAVLCADRVQGHVHGGCHASPFKVVLVHILLKGFRATARVYSSETGTWSNLISAPEQCRSIIVNFHRPSTLVGGSLYWWLYSSDDDMEILEFAIGSQTLMVIDRPPVQKLSTYRSQIIQGEDGGVGVAVLSYLSLQTWDRKVGFGGEVATTWVLRKTVNLQLVPNMRATQSEIVGYVEEEDAILVRFSKNVFIVRLDSTKANKLCEYIDMNSYHPFTSFYSSGSSSVVSLV